MGEQIDFRKIISKGLTYWYLFVTIPLLIIMAAYFYLESAQPKYEAYSLLLIKDDENSGKISEEAIFEELGLSTGNKNLENEVMLIRATPILKEVVKNLGLQYNYTSVNGLTKRNLYKHSPIQVVNWKPAYDYSGLMGEVFVNPYGGYRLETEEEVFTGEFGKELEMPLGKVTLSRVGDQTIEGSVIVEILPEEVMAWSLVERLEVEIMGEKSSTLRLAIKDVSKDRSRDILNNVMDVYNQKTITDKNKVFEGTIDLINERVQLINEELSEAEQDVESYKRQNNVMELSAEGSMLLTEMTGYNKQISETGVQLEILNSIESFLLKNENFEFVPTNLSLQNLTLSNQIVSFNELLAERERKRTNLGPSHPDLKLIEKQIQNFRNTIIENIQSMKSDLQITRSAIADQKSTLQGRMSSLPRRERELIEIERRKNIKENLYLYLLQKRESSAISLAITASTGEIIEPAYGSDNPVSPKRAQIWLIALFLGAAVPVGIAMLLDALNNKILTQEDIEAETSVPVAGILSQHKKKGNVVVKKESRTVIAEMFRLLRANLAYISPEKDLKTLLVTSSVSGEGKSFISLNLAMTLALTGKKVLILELDLRKPKQEAYLNIEKTKDGIGIVNYLVDPSMCYKQIIRNTGINENLDFISSGPKPPNPSELILSPRLRELMTELKTHYDFIILDAPPVGLVADALQMKDLAEATMYVVRNGFTRRPQLKIIDNIAENDKLPRPFIVLNGVKINGMAGYGNGYYGYGYGNSKGYYED